MTAPSPPRHSGAGGGLFEEQFQRFLQKVEGARAVAVVGADGIPVSRLGAGQGPDIDLVTAMLADTVGRLRRACQESESGSVVEFMATTDAYAFLLRAVTEDYLMLAILERGGSLGRARFELRHAAARLKDELI